eukprot:CAMPEP_0172373098 /NCGR_PEP_ID=MMETSP1060-20121228/50269_1 /TAXON_ID=37318 /ORGANISM="Pseudo-nitzschia pungens, Strain cf. cingulata" /LENGTH=251 /DNA_ID=CAMNT_0013099309 /DNA_START=224 /DNA_END=979 /DNA_ORIENTATION=+
MEAILLFGACSAAESLGRMLFTIALGSSSDPCALRRNDSSCSSEAEFGPDPRVDEISVVPVCDDDRGDDNSSPWRIMASNSSGRRQRRSVRFSKPSTIDTIVIPLSSSCASTYDSTTSASASSHRTSMISPDRTTTICSSFDTHDEIGMSDLFVAESSLPSTPAIEVSLGLDTSFSSSSSSVEFSNSVSSLSQQYASRRALDRHRCLGHTKRIRRVRTLLKDDFAHRQRIRESLIDSTERKATDQSPVLRH